MQKPTLVFLALCVLRAASHQGDGGQALRPNDEHDDMALGDMAIATSSHDQSLVSAPEGTTTTTTTTTGVPVWRIYPAMFLPGDVPEKRTSPVNLGTIFKTSHAGSVRALRFWRKSAFGKVTLTLWDREAKKQLASAELNIAEGDAFLGWKRVELATPVVLTADKEYIVAYHTTTLFGAVNPFRWPRMNGPLVGVMSVYKYSATPDFPESHYQAINYYTDVEFAVAGTYTKSVSVFGAPAPDSVTEGAGGEVNAGMHFRVIRSGVATGLRAYRMTEPGPITGYLFEKSGKLLGKATFPTPTAVGWLSVKFPQPIRLNYGVNYIVSYYSPSGKLPTTAAYPWPRGHSPLLGIQSCLKYGPAGSLPDQCDPVEHPNYWADLWFDDDDS